MPDETNPFANVGASPSELTPKDADELNASLGAYTMALADFKAKLPAAYTEIDLANKFLDLTQSIMSLLPAFIVGGSGGGAAIAGVIGQANGIDVLLGTAIGGLLNRLKRSHTTEDGGEATEDGGQPTEEPAPTPES